MKNKLLIIGFLFSIILISLIGIYTLSTEQKLLQSINQGENHFKEITTAATEIASYAKRAEGHLFLYINLHRVQDKNKFPMRVKSLNAQISILESKLKNREAIRILDKIKSNTREIIPGGNFLIVRHDKAMKARGKIDFKLFENEIFRLHDIFSNVRKFGVELAKFEINLESELKLALSENFQRQKKYLRIMIILFSAFALCLGYLLIRMTNNLNIEIYNRKKSEKVVELERNKLQNALENVKTLSGLLPICSGCKKVRDDEGYWNQIDSYIEKHSDAQFSHGLCEDCTKEYYGIEPPAVKAEK
jgi:hypothetical protein